MTVAGTPALAFVLLALFTLAGWGVLRLIAPAGMPADATLALGPVVGVAAFSILAAVLVPVLPSSTGLVLLACVLLATAACGATRLRWLLEPRPRRARAAAALAIVLVALLLAALPSLLHGSGAAASWGNADPYLWVSQANSIVSGPVPKPDTLFPDRVAYEHISGGGWAPGLPALIALAAAGTRQDPADVFGAIVALLFSLTPFVAYVLARLTLGWRFRLSITAALLVAVSPYRLYAAYYGWEPQLTGVACLLAAAIAFRIALSVQEAPRRWLLLAAVLIAGALGVYRLPFLPYVVFVLGLVAIGYFFRHRARPRAALGTIARRLAVLVPLSMLLAPLSVLALLGHAGTFWTRQGDIAPWTDYVRAVPSDALGLVPRLPDLTQEPVAVWRLLAVVAALAVLVRGLTALRVAGGGRDYPDLVATLTIGSVLAVAVAQLPYFTPYYSIKLMAYSAVPMVIVALTPLRDRAWPRPELAFAGLLVLASLASVLVNARTTMSAASLEPLRSAAASLPRSQTLRIDYRSTWKQMWAVYFTRDHPTSITHASDFLTGLGLRRNAAAYVHRAQFGIRSLRPVALVRLDRDREPSREAVPNERNPAAVAVRLLGSSCCAQVGAPGSERCDRKGSWCAEML